MFNLSKELHLLSHSEICQLIITNQLCYKPFYGIRKIGMTAHKEVVLLGFDIAHLTESQGISLEMILTYCQEKQYVIDWVTYWMGMRLLHKEKKTILKKLETLSDFNSTLHKTVITQLTHLFNL